MQRRNLRQRLRSETDGQALVEFAIVAPLIVMMLLFAVWFYELVQIKLKVQEAARYAAWEPTAHRLHDYRTGPAALSALATSAIAQVSAEATVRYADMNSATLLPLSNRIFAASWDPPLIFNTNQQEEAVYGGPMVNFIFGIGASIFDALSSLSFRNTNYVAQSLIASGRNWGGARTARIFGSPEWGMNRRGYICSRVAVMVTNNWFNNGVGRFIMPNPGVVITEPPRATDPRRVAQCGSGVLADSWRLNQAGVLNEVYGGLRAPGAPRMRQLNGYWQQVNRMYFVNRRTQAVARSWIVGAFKSLMDAALRLSASESSGPSAQDFVLPSVVSRNYTNRYTGQAILREDLPPFRFYDTAPVTGAYRDTLGQRGRYFMGCRQGMQLGCTDTLAQDNPFGSYIVR